MTLRPDLKIISQWIRPNSRVLDLGCGDGTLLRHLRQHSNVSGYGIEICNDNILTCLSNGIDVIHNNIETSLADFADGSFDYVVMTQTLQSMRQPIDVIREILRIGNEGIVTFPNFGHWKTRASLFFKGRMPKNDLLPYEWYNTPNIHLCTLQDFEHNCRENAFKIQQRAVVDTSHRNSALISAWPNLFAEIAIYRLQQQ
jgi:methionine biosynthesis protein MetW